MLFSTKYNLLLILLNFCQLISCEEFVCKHNIDIINRFRLEDIQRLSNCSRVEGYVRILLLDSEISTDKLNGLTFPKLTEITDYLLIFRISIVTTLENWFPNLQYIRGRTLFYGYAIVVNDLSQLKHLGFHRLKHIRGGVRIENTPELCFAHTLDYQTIIDAFNSSHSSKQKWTQILPGFQVVPKQHNYTLVRWDYSPVIRNTKIDYFIIKSFKTEDSALYKTFQQNNCHLTEDNESLQEFDSNITEYDICYANDESRRTNESYDFISIYQDLIDPIKFYRRLMAIIPPTNALKQPIVAYEIESKNTIQSKPMSSIYELNHKMTGIASTAYNTTVFPVQGLKHFTSYLITVTACQRLNCTDCTDNCFIVAKTKTKTLPLESADTIDESSVVYTTNNVSVRIQWQEPQEPNGAIIKYDIEYQELSNKTVHRICVNRLHFKLNNNSHTIDDLKYDVNYSFRLRAISLGTTKNSVQAKWTQLYYFNMTSSGQSYKPIITEIDDNLNGSDPGLIVYLTVGLSVLLIAFVLTATICYLRAPKKSKSKVDIVSVNPEYEKFIVDPEWEVKKSDIKMFHILGDGAFGRVHYGELRTGTRIVKCAIKTLNPNRAQQRDSFLKEANIMKSFVDCHHIVKLIGIVSVENPVLVLMEYMVNGDLKTYLRFNRPDSDENPNPRVPDIHRIFQMAIEIADGMAYLSARKYVHRDLAARNCMVAEDLTVKIGDFGMTRDVYDNDYYRKRDCCLIPVRWMSPEALRDGVFTKYSDIWAYGVVLWEMVTLGAQPYQGYSNESVFQNVIRGVRLTQPDNCPKKLWRIMQFCWRKNPKSRPSFNEITEYLMPSANQSFREVCYYLKHKKNEQSIRKLFYGLIPTNSLLLNDIKPNDETESIDNYCPMTPALKLDSDLNEEQIRILNQMNEINNTKTLEMNNCYKTTEETTKLRISLTNDFIKDRNNLIISEDKEEDTEQQYKIQLLSNY